MVDPFGRAVRDWYLDDLSEPLIQRDGPETLEHPIEEFYFAPADLDSGSAAWFGELVDGPVLDLGAGAGRLALSLQERYETVAVEVSDHLVETMDERGVDDARQGDMFDLETLFPGGRFHSVLVVGTQAGLAGSRTGLVEFLEALAAVTTEDGTAIIDSYDPSLPESRDLLGYRSDPAPGLAFRVFHFEYEDKIGETLLFRLVSPDALRSLVEDTVWNVAEVDRPGESSFYYRCALEK